MGIFDNLRNFFKGSNNTPIIQENYEDKKSTLATQTMNLIDRIKKINSLDSSLWNLANITKYELERKSLPELEQLHSRLYSRYLELTRQSQRKNPERESIEASKWTGQKPQHLTDYEFDRLQRDEGR